MQNYTKAPTPDIAEAFQSYIEHGIPTGGFLMAVLCNDLKEACGRADDYNRRILFEIVVFLYNEAPSTCWGSPEKVDAWLDAFRKKREQVA